MREKYIINICEHCTDDFESSRYDAKYCGGSCRTAAARARKKNDVITKYDDWVMETDAETRENFYFVRTNSDTAAELLSVIANQYGINAAFLATHAARNAVVGEMKIRVY